MGTKYDYNFNTLKWAGNWVGVGFWEDEGSCWGGEEGDGPWGTVPSTTSDSFFPSSAFFSSVSSRPMGQVIFLNSSFKVWKWRWKIDRFFWGQIFHLHFRLEDFHFQRNNCLGHYAWKVSLLKWNSPKSEWCKQVRTLSAARWLAMFRAVPLCSSTNVSVSVIHPVTCRKRLNVS